MYFSIFTNDRFAVDVIGRDTRYALSGFKHFLNDLGYSCGTIFGSRAILQDRVHGRTVIYVPFNTSVLNSYIDRYPFPDDFVFHRYSLPVTDPFVFAISAYVRDHYSDSTLYSDLSDIYGGNLDLLEGYISHPIARRLALSSIGDPDGDLL